MMAGKAHACDLRRQARLMSLEVSLCLVSLEVSLCENPAAWTMPL